MHIVLCHAGLPCVLDNLATMAIASIPFLAAWVRHAWSKLP
jgi:hypothetical protein